jgi:paraquat-inducible protein B
MSDIIEPPSHPRASTRRASRFPVIWLIPLVAVAIGAWLAWDTYSKKGPTITVTFESAEGLQAGQSQLKFKDIVLGTVQSFALTPDNSHVTVTIATTRQAQPLLTDQTVFWVVKPRLFAGNLSGLDTLLSGAYVSMLPSQTAGKAQTSFTGLEDPPLLEANEPGHTFLIKAARLGSISVGSPVFFRDLDVGQVLGWNIADMAESVTIRVFVRAPYDGYVNDETRFWNASGFSVKLGGTGVEVQLESLRAILLGGIAFETPAESAQLGMSAENHVFPLFADHDSADNASYSRKIQVVSYFSGSVRGLAPGSEVTMHGLMIGHVTNVALRFDPTNNTVLAPIHYEIEPERITGLGAKAAFTTPAEGAAALLKRGLRASLQTTNLLTGQQAVALEFIPDAPQAPVVMEGPNFVLPSIENGGLSSLTASAAALLDKVNTIPFTQIGQNINGILQNVNNLTNSEQMHQSLTDLASAVSKANDFVHHLDTETTPALKQLPDVMTNLQKTMGNVNQLFVSLDNGYGDNTKFSRDLERLMAQLDEAVRSFRSLADVLVQHPESLIKGRPVGEPQ